ncbi:hypothetical protein [Sporosarcina sp.]|uniref:hypothetical protein n=1 Tax=Sporosarcina sp. TaxID=49982 RepID=UPI00260CD4C1|nr:hypothetical protein [Sporosarcina sp.]
MKEFITVFITCLVFGGAFTFFLAGYILDNFWGTFLIIAFLLSAFITVLVKMSIKIEELEKKVESLMIIEKEK